MDFIWESITDWLKEILISGIVSNLSGMFDSTNEQVGNIIGQVGMTPQSWNSGIFTMIQNLSNTVVLPIAGAILAIVMTLELIQLITDRNNLNDVDTWMFFNPYRKLYHLWHRRKSRSRIIGFHFLIRPSPQTWRNSAGIPSRICTRYPKTGPWSCGKRMW